MKHRTDQELGELLKESMRAKESLVRDDVARRIARETRPARPRWPRELAAVAAVLVVVVGGLFVALRAKADIGGGSIASTTASTSPLSPTSTAQSDGLTTEEHRQMAAAASEAALAAFQPPPQSLPIEGRPFGWVQGIFGGPVTDPSLSRDSWWSTSLSTAEVSTYLQNNPPVGMVVSGGGRNPGGDVTPHYLQYQAAEASHPMAYSRPQVVVYYETLNGRTYLNAASSVYARYGVPEPFRIDKPIDQIIIDTQVVTTKNGKPWTRAKQYTPLDLVNFPNQISELVDAYNALPGSFTVNPQSNLRCALVEPGFTRVTFYSGSVENQPEYMWQITLTNGCMTQAGVWANGQTLDGTLDPTGWLTTVQDVIAQLPEIPQRSG